MRILGKILTAVLLFFTSPSTAEIKSQQIRSSNQSIIFFDEFMFTHNGYVSVTISSVSLTSPSQPDLSRLGFFLVWKRQISFACQEWENQPDTFCVLRNSTLSSVLFTFQDLSSPPQSSFSKLHHVTYPREYDLYFANCNPNTLVTMDVLTELYNIDNGITKDYLSAGRTQIPSLYFIFSIIYLCYLGFWVLLCFKNLKCFHRIHLLMGWLLVMIAVNLFCEAKDKYHVKVTGIHQRWDVFFYNFQFFRVVLLFTVLIVTGWCLRKTNLQKKENQELDIRCWMIAISVRVMANVAYQVKEESFPSDEGRYDWLIRVVLVLLDIVVALWLPASSRSSGLREDEVDHTIKEFTSLEHFVVSLFILRFGVYMAFEGYEYQWVPNAADEILCVVFYMVIFYIFRPV